MTDLPQLHDDLVAAAARRRKRARLVSSALCGAVVAAAVAGGLVVAAGDRGRDVELPATPPADASEALDRAFAVFRRPERPSDRYPGRRVPTSPAGERVDRSRLVAQVGEIRYFLIESGDSLCLVGASGDRPTGGGCGPISLYLDGKRPSGSYSDEPGPSDIVFAFPDRVENVQLELADGETIPLTPADNAVARHIPRRAVRLSWTAPDGTPQKIEFHAAPAFDPADFYELLKRPARTGDDLAGAPGARLASEDGDARSWLVARDGAICLSVRVEGATPSALEGCRAKVADVRRAIVISLRDPRVGHFVFAAFPDGADDLELLRSDGTSTTVEIRDNAASFRGEGLDAIRYRSPADTVQTDRIPASADVAVLNAVERPQPK